MTSPLKLELQMVAGARNQIPVPGRAAIALRTLLQDFQRPISVYVLLVPEVLLSQLARPHAGSGLQACASVSGFYVSLRFSLRTSHLSCKCFIH